MEDVLSEGEWWLRHIPLPRLLDVLIQVLAGHDAKGVFPHDVLEEVLPSLCFSLPQDAQGCVALLTSLPQKTKVWEKLEEGLSSQKHLPVEVTISLYTTRPSALENETIRVLSLYADDTYNEDWQKSSFFTVACFMSHREAPGESSAVNSSINQSVNIANALLPPGNSSTRGGHGRNVFVNSSQHKSNPDAKRNYWAKSPVIKASVLCTSIFNTCLSLLYKVVQGSHSVSVVFATSDYFSQVFRIVECDLYTHFPPDLQHLVYLLTLPLTSGQGDNYFQADAQVSVVQEALTKALTGGDMGVATVRTLLCFFPFWLPVLERRKFLDKYLVDWWCDG